VSAVLTTSVLTDSGTMVRRRLRHVARYPSLTVMLAGFPVVFLLLFVFVFGGTLGARLGVPGGGREAYLGYVVPGIVLMAVASVAQGTAISAATDATEGLVARFRTMAIARAAVLTGHVVAATLQSALVVLVVLVAALVLGYRPAAGPLAWLGVAGVVVLVAFALTWLTVAMGLAADSVETASNAPMPLVLLPFLGSGFVPTESMPGPLRVFAEYQPFTPWTEVLRALLEGVPPDGGRLALALAWCAVIAGGGHLWALRAYERPARR
jgi:ABC-2 type transport system permease protein